MAKACWKSSLKNNSVKMKPATMPQKGTAPLD
jgi:hypothetical protein